MPVYLVVSFRRRGERAGSAKLVPQALARDVSTLSDEQRAIQDAGMVLRIVTSSTVFASAIGAKRGREHGPSLQNPPLAAVGDD